MLDTHSYTIPLENSWLCADCQRIGASSTQCPSCASRCGLIALSGVLHKIVDKPRIVDKDDSRKGREDIGS